MHKKIWLTIGMIMILGIFWVSLTPIPPKPLDFELSDKLEHTAAYGLLMWWFAVAVNQTKHQLMLAITFVVMGIGIEFLQQMTGYRYFEVLDMVANTTGVFVGWLVSIYLTPISLKLRLRSPT